MIKPVEAYEKLFQWILNRRGFYLSSEAEREDLMQELRVAYVIAAKTYNADKKVSFVTYLTRCCTNHLGHIWEKRIKEKNEVPFCFIENAKQCSADGEELHNWLETLLVEKRFDVIDEALTRLDLERILEKLEGRDYEVFQRLSAGKTTAEIAAVLGISKQAVSQRYFKIRRLLRESVEMHLAY